MLKTFNNDYRVEQIIVSLEAGMVKVELPVFEGNKLNLTFDCTAAISLAERLIAAALLLPKEEQGDEC